MGCVLHWCTFRKSQPLYYINAVNPTHLALEPLWFSFDLIVTVQIYFDQAFLLCLPLLSAFLWAIWVSLFLLPFSFSSLLMLSSLCAPLFSLPVRVSQGSGSYAASVCARLCVSITCAFESFASLQTGSTVYDEKHGLPWYVTVGQYRG